MWIAIVAMLLGSLVTAEVGRRAAAGTLDRNHLAGIRTPATLASDEAWRAAHEVAGGTIVAVGVLSTVLTVGVAGVALAGASDVVVAVVLLVVAAVLTIGAVAAGVRGDRAARAVAAD